MVGTIQSSRLIRIAGLRVEVFFRGFCAVLRLLQNLLQQTDDLAGTEDPPKQTNASYYD
jgi:hypothetical protein